jgi:hypothetical protein
MYDAVTDNMICGLQNDAQLAAKALIVADEPTLLDTLAALQSQINTIKRRISNVRTNTATCHYCARMSDYANATMEVCHHHLNLLQ